MPVNRSELVTIPRDMDEVIISNPDIADIHVHGPKSVSVIGKKIGQTNVRIFDKNDEVIRSLNVVVSYDLPAIRKSLGTLLPNEFISLDVVNTNLALTGEVSSAAVADRAVKIVNEYLLASGGDKKPEVLNLLQISTGQQVMLRVRVGEIQRSAIKQLGINLSAIKSNGNGIFTFATGGALGGTLGGINGGIALNNDSFGVGGAGFTTGSTNLNSALEALESNGLLKVLAEPNLVALSGENAEFLAGGEFPVPVSQGTSGGTNVTIEYRSFGVAIQFTPYVLSPNRIRVSVQPEVSELSNEGAVKLNGFEVPGLTTRRAKTTVELAPGESFMIAGLISDKMQSQIQQLPGAGEVPILGALFRSSAYKRNETELVIAVTPYLVDPLKSGDVKLPTDNFQPASFMESVFYGALGSLSGDAPRISQTPNLEGPIGFMVD